MIRLEAVSARYRRNGRLVLNEVSFELPRGSIGVLLGPNGSGKSTLLKCVSGLMRYSGSIYVDNKSMEKMPLRERSSLLAYVPQDLSFAPSTVFDAVMVGRLSHFGLSPSEADQKAVWEALDDLGLRELALNNVLELSGGERQKVALARALAQNADILVLDEPTSNLDIAAEMNIVSLARNLAKERGFTMILSMHDLNLALSLGDYFAFLKGGKLLSFGGRDTIDSKTISATFGIAAERVCVDGREYIIYGEKQ